MFSILTSKIFGGLSVALALALAATVFIYEGTVASYQNQLNKADGKITTLQTNLTTARINNATLDSGLKQCNTSVDNFSSVARSAAIASASAVKAAQAQRSVVTQRTEHVAAMPSATCEDAKAILKAGGRNGP